MFVASYYFMLAVVNMHYKLSAIWNNNNVGVFYQVKNTRPRIRRLLKISLESFQTVCKMNALYKQSCIGDCPLFQVCSFLVFFLRYIGVTR